MIKNKRLKKFDFGKKKILYSLFEIDNERIETEAEVFLQLLSWIYELGNESSLSSIKLTLLSKIGRVWEKKFKCHSIGVEIFFVERTGGDGC